jgi:hypothetical protein
MKLILYDGAGYVARIVTMRNCEQNFSNGV